MAIKFANNNEAGRWNRFVLDNPDGGNVFQSVEFGEQKKLSGWKPLYVFVNNIAVLILEKKVAGLGSMWYVPKGPGVGSAVQLADMVSELRGFASKSGAFAIKLEPEIKKTDDATSLFNQIGLRSVHSIQPNVSTVLIDLKPPVETILANLNQKGRHAIRRAERDGVKIRRVQATDENCRLFYQLLSETAIGQRFSVRSFEYQKAFWQRFTDAGMGQLFFAYVDRTLVAGAFALIYGDKSTYKDGASVREKVVYGASHLLQWEVIKWAKENRSKVHDLCGTPQSSRIGDESHPHYGIGRFKTSFNKQVTDYVGAYDIVVKPRQYAIWVRYGERLTKRLWWRKHHEGWY
jgi:lipid II:glycine glycyltransferase (peptidoglycan interpeptide bridge formation enzyme)